MRKQEIRKHMKQRRLEMTQEERNRQNAAIRRRLFQEPIWNDIHWFYPFVSYGTEVDTQEIICEVLTMAQQGQEIHVAVPRVDGDTMDFYEIKSMDELAPGNMGILEPVTNRKVYAKEGLMLLPGLAFDHSGNRIGYGGGYYDRYLEQYGSTLLHTWAIGFDYQLVDQLEIEEHDIQMERVITPKKKGIIFDLDGTLWDSAAAVAKSWMEQLDQMPEKGHYIMTEEKLKGYMGKTMEVIAYSFFHDVSHEKALELIQRCGAYENDYVKEHGGILFDQVENTLKLLHEEYFLAIVSNCQIGYIEAFLAHYGFEKYFDDTENYGNTLMQKGDNIKLVVERNHLEQAIYLGDTQGDYEATCVAGLPFIHAAYGFGQVEAEVPAIHSFAELPEKIKNMWN